MRCKAIRSKADTDEDGKIVVSIVVGNMRPVGSVDEIAWMELPPAMAREVALGLLEAVSDAERMQRSKTT